MNKSKIERVEVFKIGDIDIYIKRKSIKNINLRINRNLEVTVSANKRVSTKYIQNFVLSKINWINKNLEKIRKYKLDTISEKKIEYVDGDKFKIEGNTYILKVIQSDLNSVKIEGSNICIYTKDILDYNKKKNMLNKYMIYIASKLYILSLDRMLDLVAKYNISKPTMTIRKMKTRWGSCNRTKKKITINLELLKAYSQCLDYVMLHELVHFLVKEHNTKFYGYMTLFMPDWKSRKKLLKETFKKGE